MVFHFFFRSRLSRKTTSIDGHRLASQAHLFATYQESFRKDCVLIVRLPFPYVNNSLYNR